MAAASDGGSASGSRSTIAAAIALVTLVGLSLSLLIPLLSLEMERMGIASTTAGLNVAVGGVSNLVVVPFVPRLAALIGVRSLIVLAIAAGAAATIAFHVSPFWVWFPLRFVLGAALGTLFVLSEFWINAAAPPARRGLVMGIYATVLALGFAAGPLLLSLTGTGGLPPYLAGAALFALALVPLAMAGGATPAIGPKARSRVGHFILAAPTATFAALLFGAIETGGFALLPVFGLRTGFDELSAARLVTLAAIGNVLFQIPLGLLSDRVDRRVLILVISVLGAAGTALFPLATTAPVAFQIVLCLWGGVTGGLYTLGLAHLGARVSGSDLASANAAFVMFYSAGLIVGPPAVGAGMDMIGPQGFALVLGLMLAAFALFVASRLIARPERAATDPPLPSDPPRP